MSFPANRLVSVIVFDSVLSCAAAAAAAAAAARLLLSCINTRICISTCQVAFSPVETGHVKMVRANLICAFALCIHECDAQLTLPMLYITEAVIHAQ